MSRTSHADSLQGDATDMALLECVRNETKGSISNEKEPRNKTFESLKTDTAKSRQVIPLNGSDNISDESGKVFGKEDVHEQRGNFLYDNTFGLFFRMRRDSSGIKGREKMYGMFHVATCYSCSWICVYACMPSH
jgi:hypothetical protein